MESFVLMFLGFVFGAMFGALAAIFFYATFLGSSHGFVTVVPSWALDSGAIIGGCIGAVAGWEAS